MVLARDVFGAFGSDHGFHPKTLGNMIDFIWTGWSINLENSIVFNYGKSVWWPIGFIVHGWAFVETLLIGFGLDYAARERLSKAGKRIPKNAAKDAARA